MKKKANNVSPAIHRAVEKHITDPNGNPSKMLQASDEFLLAKQLLADLPIVPTNERVYELMQDIQIGAFQDISSTQDAHNCWSVWKQRTVELLKARGILASRLKRNYKQN